MTMREREALQALEMMLRPGEGQCASPTIAHKVLVSFMEECHVPADVEGENRRLRAVLEEIALPTAAEAVGKAAPHATMLARQALGIEGDHAH